MDEPIDSTSLPMAALQHAVEQHAVAHAYDVRLMRLSLALVNHYGAGGNVSEDILQTILSTGPLKRRWVVRFRMRIAHQRRPLPRDIAIALAEEAIQEVIPGESRVIYCAILGLKEF
jgi:hypothetical protein